MAAMYNNGKATRDRILSTAKNLFLTRGYKSTTYQDICDEANVNPGTLSHHFGGKSKLGMELFQDVMKQIISVVKEKGDRSDDLLVVLTFAAAYYLLAFQNIEFRRFFIEYTVYAADDDASFPLLDNDVTSCAVEQALGKDEAKLALPLIFGIERAFSRYLLANVEEMDCASAIPFFLTMAYAFVPNSADLVQKAYSTAEGLKLRFSDFAVSSCK